MFVGLQLLNIMEGYTPRSQSLQVAHNRQCWPGQLVWVEIWEQDSGSRSIIGTLVAIGYANWAVRTFDGRTLVVVDQVKHGFDDVIGAWQISEVSSIQQVEL